MKLRWPHWTAGGVLAVIVCALAVIYIVRAGIIDPWVERNVVRQIEQRTGGRVELGAFHFELWRLRAELDNLTLHGLESASEPPLFHADRVNVDLHIVSFFRRKIALDELIVERPQVYVRYAADGKNNLPTPRVNGASRPWRQTLFDFTVGRFELNSGALTYNDRRTPLDVRGNGLAFRLLYDRSAAGSQDSYVGQLDWQNVEIALKKDAPFRAGVSAKFTLHRESFSLDELVARLPHSEINLTASLPSFSASEWDVRYRGRLSLADVKTIFRQPSTPDGTAEFSGEGHYADAEWTASGYYNARDIKMNDVWFHESGMQSSGNFTYAQNNLRVPNLHVAAFGGTVDGRLDLDTRAMAFRTQTRVHGDSLAQIFAALNHPGFPVNSLHWDALMDVDSTNTWTANFQHFRSQGTSHWSPPAVLAAGTIPISAQIAYDYSQDKKAAALTQSEISSPSMKLDFDGTLGALDSALEVQFQANDLREWNSFVNAIRGPAAPQPIAGTAVWRGRVLGPIVGPTFVGHVHSDKPQYGKYSWDVLDADMEYSPDELKLANVTGTFGGATARNLNLTLQLDRNWNFAPSNTWTLTADIANLPSDAVQNLMATDYPVSGVFSGALRGGGTHAHPTLDSDFTFRDIATRGFHFDRVTGQLHWENGEVRLANAQLTSGTGRVSGNISYRSQDQYSEFDLTGSNISLEQIEALQTKSLPIAGRLEFTLKGSGPIRSPAAQGELQLADLSVGSEMQGAVHGRFTSDGRNATATFTSELARGKLDGQLSAQLTGDVPVSGKFSFADFDIDSLIVAGLHLNKLTGHSSADGAITLSGALRRPETIQADADISKISFAYQFVQLTNDQNIRLSYTRNQVRVEQAHLHGTDTDLQIGGSARFDGDRPLALTLGGAANLRLLGGIIPDLETQGQTTINISVAGTMARPQITGRAHVQNAAANYLDFPVGLSKLNGDFVFDQSRLTFAGLTAEAGGGQLTLSGNMTYGAGERRFDVNATTSTVRIRYPAGMSWLAGGTLRLSGTPDRAILTGNVGVQRVLLGEGVDVASFFAAASNTAAAPPSSSPFLRNLSFDVSGQATPGARIEWSGAQIDMDGDVRLRGTWDRPVILGNLHLLGGEMAFRGNNYQLTRGDINFANPFRLDPVLNIEATTTISHYQVTIDFTGPASHLVLNYRSDPPLPDSEIVTLLALGNTGESAALMSGTASQNYGATALLSEAISTGLGGRIEHLFGISHFSVDPFVAETAPGANAAARVTIEQQITRGLTITYSTNAATSNQYQLIQVEYAVKRNLSIVFLRDINGTYGMDIKFVKHLK